jgi:hypothetical protein
VARTLDGGHGIRVDLNSVGTAIGVEITTPGAVSVAELKAVLAEHGVTALDAEE